MVLPKLVIRYIFGGRSSTKFITLIALIGVFLASSSMLLTIGVMNGFEKSVKEGILSTTPHISVFVGDREEAKGVIFKVSKNPLVKKAYWYATFGAILQKGTQLTGAVLIGISKREEKFLLQKKGVFWKGNLTDRGIALGNILASRLGIYSIPQRVVVIAPTTQRTPIGFIPRIRRVEVSALYSSGIYNLDTEGVGYFEFLSKFLTPNTFQVVIMLKDPYRVEEFKRKLEKYFPSAFISTWIDANRDFFNALKLEKLGMVLVVGIITLVAAFNITSLLITKVRELSKDFAIFRTFGAGRNFIFGIVLSLGLALGLGGATLGVATASLIAFMVNRYKLLKVPADVYMTPYLPVVFGWGEVLSVVAFVVFLSLLAALIPAKIATSERITDILRND